jgi:hypothetical protein
MIAKLGSVVGERAKRDKTRRDETGRKTAHRCRSRSGARNCLPFGEDEQGLLYWEHEQRTIYTKIFEKKGGK